MGYWFTIIGALFKLICDLLLGMGVTGESAEFAQTIFTWLGFILSGIGIIKALLVGEGWAGKLKGVAIHALIWIVLLFGLMIVLPIVILGVVIFVVDIFFLGGSITTFIHDKFAGFVGNGEFEWPINIYSSVDFSNVYTLTDNWGEKVQYKNDKGDSIIVSLEDVEEDHINTIYGTFKW